MVRLGRSDEALSIYERIMPEEAAQNEVAARIWLAMAEAKNRAGDHGEALIDLTMVTENFESRPQGVEAFFQAGYTNEVYLQDHEAARTAYEAAVGSRARSVFKDQATIVLRL